MTSFKSCPAAPTALGWTVCGGAMAASRTSLASLCVLHAQKNLQSPPRSLGKSKFRAGSTIRAALTGGAEFVQPSRQWRPVPGVFAAGGR